MKVWIRYSEDSIYYKNGARETTLVDITEIHYNYGDTEPRVAFESDTQGTGWTYTIKDIAEFEAKVEVPKPSAAEEYRKKFLQESKRLAEEKL